MTGEELVSKVKEIQTVAGAEAEEDEGAEVEEEDEEDEDNPFG